MMGISQDLLERVHDDFTYILTPGEIMRIIQERLGLEKSGDMIMIHGGAVANLETDEIILLDMVRKKKCKIIVSLHSGKRHLFEKNDSLFPDLLKEMMKEELVIFATPARLTSLKGSPLIVDTGDPELDKRLCGFYRIMTGYGKSAIYKAVPISEKPNTPISL